MKWNGCVLWVGLVLTLWGVKGEASHALDSEDTPGRSVGSRLQEIRREFLDIVGNSSSVESMTEVLTLLHSSTGRQLGRLLLEGVMLGAQEKDSMALVSQFWTDLQERISPQLLEQFDDYRDFFRGVDLSTVPLMWEQMFKKDELGNSLAGIPLGQLVEMVQPTASRYGIDIRSFVNSLMGKGNDNARDLILEALGGFNWTSLLTNFFNSTSEPTSVQTMETDSETVPEKRLGKDKVKKGKNDKTLRLFRPLVASLLRENNIDLEADAVLELLAPLLSGDMLSQIAPLLGALGTGTKGEGGLLPLLANVLGGGGDQKQQQMGGLLGGLGALLAGGKDKNMDLGAMLNLASMFMDNGKPVKKNKKRAEKAEDNKGGLDMGSLLSLAGQLAENNNINIGSVLDATNRILSPEKKAKSVASKETKVKTSTPASKKLKYSPKNNSPRHLIDIIEPILLTMQKDKQCNRKIKDAVLFGKALLNKKMSNWGNLKEYLPLYLSSFVSDKFMAERGLNLDMVVNFLEHAFTSGSLTDLLDNLENEDYRETLIRTVAPHVTELVLLVSSKEVQYRMYDATGPTIKAYLASFGMPGVTLDNFPEKMAPLVGVLGKGWNLPFNPTTILIPLRDYIRDTRRWGYAELERLWALKESQVESEVSLTLEEVCQGILAAGRLTQDERVDCLKPRLCQATQGLHTFAAGTTRSISFALAVVPVIETQNSATVVKIAQAVSGSIEDCEDPFPEECIMEEPKTGEDDESQMNLDYDHQEL